MAYTDVQTDDFEEPADGEAVPESLLPDAGPQELFTDTSPIEIGGIVVLPRSGQHRQLLKWSDPNQSPNIAEDILNMPDGEGKLNEIGERVLREYRIDDQSRSEWKDRTRQAIELAMQITKTKESPWPNASNVIYPLLTMASQQFAARAYPAIIAGPDVVKGTIVGDDEGVPQVDPATGQPAIGPDGAPVMVGAGEKRSRAERIGEHMSWQLLEEQPEWEDETDTLLHVLPIVGCEFRKTFFEPADGRNYSLRVSAENLVVNYWAKSLDTAPRATEELKYYPVEIKEKVAAGIFLEHEYGLAPDNSGDEDAPHEFVEQHRRLDLDEDGYPEPYVVTVHKLSGKVARIVARYDADGIKLSRRHPDRIQKIEAVQYYTKYQFLPAPDGGFYGSGFGQVLLPLNSSVNTTLNMLLDAGHLANTGGGFIGKGASMHTGALRFRPGEWKVVNAAGTAIRDAMVQLDINEPSAVLFNLLGMLITAGEKVASVNEVLTGNQTRANVPATTTLALIEQGLKLFTAVYKRIHRSLKHEYDKLFRLNRLYLDQQAQYRRGEEWRKISLDDYRKGAGVEPVSDPAMVSDMQKLARAEILKEFMNDPLVDGVEIRRRFFRAVGLEDIDQLLKPAPAPNPMAELKAAELEIKRTVGRAQALNYMASAIKSMAEADEKVAETFNLWITAQMTVLQGQVEALSDGEGSAAGSARDNPGGLPSMAPPPGYQGPAPLPV